MREASPVKYYFAKYFFLAFGLLQWIGGMLLFLKGDAEKNKSVALIFFLIGLTFIALYFEIAAKLKRVSIGKKRIIVVEKDKTECYSWPEVKSIKAVPYFNLYKLRLRGKKERIYFLPEQTIEPVFGYFQSKPAMADVLRKKGK
jgi:hypothetical protein